MEVSPRPKTVSMRQLSARWSAALMGGPADLLDFLLPLWAGAALGLDASLIGLLVATELLVSFVARFPAGLLSDRRERRSIAAVGATLYGISCIGYAFSAGPGMAFTSAAIGGIGGALFWVSLRAIVSENASSDSFSFARLMSWQETGSWVAFVAGLTLIGSIDYRGVFLVAGLACFAASVTLAIAPRRPFHPPDHKSFTFPTQRLRPMLLATAVTSLAEGAIGLLLLLHLQVAFELDVVTIAFVFLPGAIAMSLLPKPAQRLTMQIGRRKVAAIAATSSAAFAFSLAFAPSAIVIAVLWILSAAAWAAIIPIEQSVIAEVAAERAGRGFGLYETAKLAGAGLGALLAGISYETTTWQVACIVFAVVIASGAVITPWAVRRSGVDNFPRDEAASEVVPPEPNPVAQTDEEIPAAPSKGNRSKITSLGWHLLIFAVVQGALAVAGWSWILDSFTTSDFSEHLSSGGRPDLEGNSNLIYSAGRIWAIVIIVDVIWTFATSRKNRRGSGL